MLLYYKTKSILIKCLLNQFDDAKELNIHTTYVTYVQLTYNILEY